MARASALFVDTSAWIALGHRRDQANARALKVWPAVHRGRRYLVTTGLVAAETHALLRRRVGSDAAVAFLDALFARPHGEVVWPDAELARAAAERWVRGYPDQDFTLTDAVSFEVMRQAGITEAFTFDRDFERAGFKVLH